MLALISGATVCGLAGCGGDGGADTPTRTTTGDADTPTESPEASTSGADETPTNTPDTTTVAETPRWDSGVIRAMSFNIRYDNPNDEPPWSDRRERVVDAIRAVDPDVVGCQEALPHQFTYLREQLDGYAWYGVGRDGGDEGEHTPVGWRSDRFEMIDTGTFWLSETPDEPGSVGWDADLPRIASWVDLEFRSGTRFRAYSTHFSHVSAEARENSSRLLRERIEDRIVDRQMSVLMGDFNFEPDSAGHQALTRSGIVDARQVAATVEGPEGTFQEGLGSGAPGRRIDYVFLPMNVPVRRFRTLPPAETLRSDHLPVVADIDRETVESTFG
jgi:endonuclease/exonuclease/phosphatase family metal-dependent hydrolase